MLRGVDECVHSQAAGTGVTTTRHGRTLDDRDNRVSVSTVRKTKPVRNGQCSGYHRCGGSGSAILDSRIRYLPVNSRGGGLLRARRRRRRFFARYVPGCLDAMHLTNNTNSLWLWGWSSPLSRSDIVPTTHRHTNRRPALPGAHTHSSHTRRPSERDSSGRPLVRTLKRHREAHTHTHTHTQRRAGHVQHAHKRTPTRDDDAADAQPVERFFVVSPLPAADRTPVGSRRARTVPRALSGGGHSRTCARARSYRSFTFLPAPLHLITACHWTSARAVSLDVLWPSIFCFSTRPKVPCTDRSAADPRRCGTVVRTPAIAPRHLHDCWSVDRLDRPYSRIRRPQRSEFRARRTCRRLTTILLFSSCCCCCCFLRIIIYCTKCDTVLWCNDDVGAVLRVATVGIIVTLPPTT